MSVLWVVAFAHQFRFDCTFADTENLRDLPNAEVAMCYSNLHMHFFSSKTIAERLGQRRYEMSSHSGRASIANVCRLCDGWCDRR